MGLVKTWMDCLLISIIMLVVGFIFTFYISGPLTPIGIILMIFGSILFIIMLILALGMILGKIVTHRKTFKHI